MKTTINYLAILLATFALAFLTSLLLDLAWVQKQWSRTAMVTLLMLLQLLLGGLTLWAAVKNNQKNNNN